MAVQFLSRMRRAALVFASALVVFAGGDAFAQDPPPPIPRVVVDLHGVIPVFPNDSTQLGESRDLPVPALPGAGFGGRVGAHVYLLKISGITIGAGGEVMLGRSSSTPPDPSLTLVA